MWSKGYKVPASELRELHSAMERHDGLFYLAAAAGVADHKAQGDRLDFGSIFKAYRDEFPFMVGRRAGSPAARQRNVISITSPTISLVSVTLFSLSSILLLLFKISSCLERRAHCWFAAERAASLADAVPPCAVRADTV